MKINIIWWIQAVFVLLIVPATTYAAKTSDGELMYEKGYVTCHRENIPLNQFLETLSQAAGLQVVLTDPMDLSRNITVHFDHKPIDDVVKTLLRGYSYALVFNAQDEPQQQRLVSYHDFCRSAGDDVGKPFLSPEKARAVPATKKERVEHEIETIQQRIQSGESDREYEKWAAVRGAKYVTHDRDRLEKVQRQFETLDE
jgi:type II secretory pathway component GspD/PulD (secretin)